MDQSFSTNMTTWYIIFPLLLVAFVGLVWLVAKLRVRPCQRIGVAVTALFAFVGFAAILLGVYYHTNQPFAGAFRSYAFAALAPAKNPFTQPDSQEILTVVGMLEVTKEDGQVQLPDIQTRLGYDYGLSIFTPGKWHWAKVTDRTVSLLDSDSDGQPESIDTSLWWALTKDLYRLDARVE